MALIDKETIRAEIERRKNNAETMREREAYIGLLNYLDTFPEQPVEGLEEIETEVDKTFFANGWYEGDHHQPRLDISLEGFRDIASHFYELGCRHTAVMYDDIEHERQRAEEAEERDKEPATIAFERLHGLNSKK